MFKNARISGRATFGDGITRPVTDIPGDLMIYPEFLVYLENLPMFHIVGRSNGAELTFQLSLTVISTFPGRIKAYSAAARFGGTPSVLRGFAVTFTIISSHIIILYYYRLC